jgi:hypothetical protein
VIIAGALLNIGFYFLLFIFAPIIAGIASGFLLLNPKEGSIGGFMASIVAYIPLFTILELLFPRGDTILAILGAAILLAVVGSVGGAVGGFLSKRTTSS